MLVRKEGRLLEAKSLGGGAPDVRHLRVAFAAPVANLGELLAALPGVKVLETGDDEAIVEFSGVLDAQSQVLRSLVGACLPVPSFPPELENLHQSHLRTTPPGTTGQGAPILTSR